MQRLVVDQLPSYLPDDTNDKLRTDQDSEISDATEAGDESNFNPKGSREFLSVDIQPQQYNRDTINLSICLPLTGLQPIQLLILEHSVSIDSPVECQLISESFSQGSRFAVLSYHRGQSEQAVRIWVGGGAKDISVQLWTA